MFEANRWFKELPASLGGYHTSSLGVPLSVEACAPMMIRFPIITYRLCLIVASTSAPEMLSDHSKTIKILESVRH